MVISKLLGKGRPERPASRYAVVAAGSEDPQRAHARDEVAAAGGPAEAGAVGDAPAGGAGEPVGERAAAPVEPVGERAAASVEPVELGPVTLDDEELARREAALAELLELMRPAVQMDGGDLALVDADYAAGVVEVELRGACGSCAISATTLQGGVERLLKERLDWVTQVVGGVDDSVDPLESAAMGRGAYVPRYY
ncbi:MAG TPA: NifU family protein [Acidimicrobiales bacterium]|nr:NifU family protein [Acidimicrobiales bacterium]